MKKSKIILISLAIIAALALGWYGYHNFCQSCFDFDHIKESLVTFFESLGPWAMVVFILLYAVNTVTILPPIAIMTLTGGVLFGGLWGGIAVLLGATLGTSATFFISRIFGAKFVGKFIKGDKAQEFQEKLGANGFLVILPMRLIGFPPWELVNYAAGLSKIKYRDYILATVLGIIPGTFGQTLIVSQLKNINFKDPKFYLIILGAIALITVPAMLVKKALKKEDNNNG